MASEGPNNPTAAIDDDTVGTIIWTNPTNCFTSNGANASTSSSGHSDVTSDEEVKLVLANDSLGSENKANTTPHWPTSDTYSSYGGSEDDWGESLTGADVNNSNFGVVIAADVDGDITHYLKATDFNFSIPATDIIDGVLVEIEKSKAYTAKGGAMNMRIDHIRITITHSSAPSAGQDGPYVY